ncbi:MrpF/PhaF family protein [Streptomyces sp. NPDC056210]|uniref:MrpF/PhaF family protein n=1 Tax=Streptomyces sp. NPDC056210 TaxID=3345746 RepID=UPI0035DFF4F9
MTDAVNSWLVAAAALLALGVGPALWGATTGPVRRRVVAQNLATLLVCLVMLLLAQGYARPAYIDLGLVLSVLGPAGTLVYARLLADELAANPPAARVTRGMTMLSVAAPPLVVVPLCVVTGPGRTLAKLLVIGALLTAGNTVSGRAVSAGACPPREADDG